MYLPVPFIPFGTYYMYLLVPASEFIILLHTSYIFTRSHECYVFLTKILLILRLRICENIHTFVLNKLIEIIFCNNCNQVRDNLYFTLYHQMLTHSKRELVRIGLKTNKSKSLYN